MANVPVWANVPGWANVHGWEHYTTGVPSPQVANGLGDRNERLPDLCFSICRFSQVVSIPRAQPHAQSLSLFPMFLVLIWFIFSMRRRTVPSFVSVIQSPAAVTPFDRSKTLRRTMRTASKSATFLATENVNSAPFKRRKRCKILARKSAKLSATKVTSLPSHTHSLSLCISLSHRAHLTHNIGSASALPILCVRYFRWERERERDTERERQRYRERDGSDVTIVALKLAMNLHFPCQKFAQLAMSLHFPLPKIRTFRFSLHTSRLSLHGEVTIVALKLAMSSHFPFPKIFFALFVPHLSNGTSRATSYRKPKTNDQILPSPILFFRSKKWMKLIPKTIGNRKRDCAWGGSGW